MNGLEPAITLATVCPYFLQNGGLCYSLQIQRRFVCACSERPHLADCRVLPISVAPAPSTCLPCPCAIRGFLCRGACVCSFYKPFMRTLVAGATAA